ncbi:MAG: aldehyde dehydrogenase family protein, partial [Saprospiraceae bacterium]|nr:aldehyde dehydrogenase family protein [Saprospiraceae bacterium]
MNENNLINGEWKGNGTNTIVAMNPVTSEELRGEFIVATDSEIDEAVSSAWYAWKSFRNSSPEVKAQFLREIANEIEDLGEELVLRVVQETGLPEGRVKGERGRTCGQLRMFADHVQEGSWVDATIDEAIPERQPIPRVDIRRMKIGLGPVAIFTASNFPLAFSTAGGDTASALAAGCPV